MNFLVVDDSKFARRKLSKLIAQLGYNVVGEAEDGLKAIEQYKKLKPDFITMDLEMPNMQGTDAAKKILEIDINTRIILITSIVDKKVILNAFKSGVKGYLTKPMTLDELKEVIDKIK